MVVVAVGGACLANQQVRLQQIDSIAAFSLALNVDGGNVRELHVQNAAEELEEDNEGHVVLVWPSPRSNGSRRLTEGSHSGEHTISHMHETAGTMVNFTMRAQGPELVKETSKSAQQNGETPLAIIVSLTRSVKALSGSSVGHKVLYSIDSPSSTYPLSVRACNSSPFQYLLTYSECRASDSQGCAQHLRLLINRTDSASTLWN